MRLPHLLVIASVLLLPLGASAQWQWIDKDNKRVFSDQPPPSDVPDSKILHRPSASSRPISPPPAPAAAAAPLVPPAPPSGDKALEEKKRQAEQAEKDRLAAEADKAAKARADNCSRAKQGKELMDSGQRVAQMNAAGERIIMDDDARAAEQKRLQAVISSDCN